MLLCRRVIELNDWKTACVFIGKIRSKNPGKTWKYTNFLKKYYPKKYLKHITSKEYMLGVWVDKNYVISLKTLNTHK